MSTKGLRLKKVAYPTYQSILDAIEQLAEENDEEYIVGYGRGLRQMIKGHIKGNLWNVILYLSKKNPSFVKNAYNLGKEEYIDDPRGIESSFSSELMEKYPELKIKRDSFERIILLEMAYFMLDNDIKWIEHAYSD